jgi:hypothetical protein
MIIAAVVIAYGLVLLFAISFGKVSAKGDRQTETSLKEYAMRNIAVTIVTMQDIARCPLHILSAEHWFPQHHVEECHPELRQKVKEYDEQAKTKRAEVKLQLEADRQLFIENLRKEQSHE